MDLLTQVYYGNTLQNWLIALGVTVHLVHLRTLTQEMIDQIEADTEAQPVQAAAQDANRP